MLGTDAPARVDAVQLTQVSGPESTSTEKIAAAIDRIRGKRLPKPDGSDDPDKLK